MIGAMAWRGVSTIPGYVYIAIWVAVALFGAWRLGRYLRSLPPRHWSARRAPEIRAVLYFACGIALGGGFATASCEVLVAHLAEPDLGETLRAARKVFAILAVLGGCAVWSFAPAWVPPRRGLRS